MSEAVKILDHGQEAVNRLVTQYQDQPLIEGLVRSLANPNQDLEDTFWDLLTLRDLETAVGKQLDGLGEIVGESRKGKNDDDYRIAIKAKIGQNVSKATPQDVISVFILLVNANTAYYMEYPPAEAAIFADVNIEALDNPAILKFMQKVMPAGSRLDYIGWYDNGNAFAFFDDPNALGFDDLFNADVGGKLATITAYV